MKGSCKGDCQNKEKFDSLHEVKRNDRDSFRLGFARCRTCEIYFKNIDRCPCCNRLLCKKPRNGKSKREYNEFLQIPRY